MIWKQRGCHQKAARPQRCHRGGRERQSPVLLFTHVSLPPVMVVCTHPYNQFQIIMHKTQLQQNFMLETFLEMNKAQINPSIVRNTFYLIEVCAVYGVTQHSSSWLCSIVSCSKLFFLFRRWYVVNFSEPVTCFARQWFCKFLTELSPPNHQQQQTSAIEVLRSRGSKRSPAIFCNIVCHEWRLETSCFLFLRLSCSIRIFEVTYMLLGWGDRKCYAAAWPWAEDSCRQTALTFGRQAAGWLGTWYTDVAVVKTGQSASI
jgi:hypothetical protein